MQVYTKILIGMLVGAVLGLVLGPKSALLTPDLYRISQWDRVHVRTDRDDPASVIALPAAKQNTEPLALPIVETIVEPRTDALAELHEVPTWSRVRLRYTRELSLRDRDGSVRARLGVDGIDDTAEVWLRHEIVALDTGGLSSWPEPVSALGDTMVQWLRPIGKAFMRLITMVIVPLVFASLVVGVASLGDVRKLGRVGARTLGLFLVTTAIAITIGLACAAIVRPGSFIDEASRMLLQAQFSGDAGDQVARAADAPSAIDNVLAIIPTNPVASLAAGDMLPVIFFSLLLGAALTFLEPKVGRPLVAVLDALQHAMVIVIHVVMKVAPIGVAALVAEVVGTSGWSVLQGLAVYAVTVLLGLALHGVLVYGAIVKLIARVSPRAFLRAIRPAQLIAFSTSSSSATLPVTMECAEQNLRISNPVASFVLPLGSTVNMDGTALYQGVAALFIAQVFQMDLSLTAQLGIVATATMASIGAAGVPGAGMITLALVLTTAGIPTIGVALILGVDRLLDMFRTMINVTGDLAVASAMARLEGETLRPLSPQADVADPRRGFENRLDVPRGPIEP